MIYVITVLFSTNHIYWWIQGLFIDLQNQLNGPLSQHWYKTAKETKFMNLYRSNVSINLLFLNNFHHFMIQQNISNMNSLKNHFRGLDDTKWTQHGFLSRPWFYDLFFSSHAYLCLLFLNAYLHEQFYRLQFLTCK